MNGCVRALRPYNAPSQEKLLIRTSTPTNCVVRVADEHEFRTGPDGRVTFDVPRLERGCDVYLFGILKIRSGDPKDLRAIHVLRDGRVARKLSLTKLGTLPVDSDGYHVLVLK